MHMKVFIHHAAVLMNTTLSFMNLTTHGFSLSNTEDLLRPHRRMTKALVTTMDTTNSSDQLALQATAVDDLRRLLAFQAAVAEDLRRPLATDRRSCFQVPLDLEEVALALLLHLDQEEEASVNRLLHLALAVAAVDLDHVSAHQALLDLVVVASGVLDLPAHQALLDLAVAVDMLLANGYHLQRGHLDRAEDRLFESGYGF